MGQYRNKFEEVIDNAPISSNWKETADYILELICNDYHEECSYFQTMQSAQTPNGDYFRTIVFELQNELYIYWDAVKDGRLECSQLERFIELSDNWENVVSLVVYSSDPTAKPLAKMVLGIYKRTTIKDWEPSLNKG